jgi:hypothetical protein
MRVEVLFRTEARDDLLSILQRRATKPADATGFAYV